MNKKDLSESLAEKFELSNVKSNEIISYVFETMTKALADNDTIQLIGFGSFSIKDRKAREGRNPKTGESIKIAALVLYLLDFKNEK
jgi:DNA-binding protein HU-beta